jgi:hypothetical protein
MKHKIKNYSQMSKGYLINQLSQKDITTKTEARTELPVQTASSIPKPKRKQHAVKPLRQEQEEIEAAKYYMGPAEYQLVEQAGELPPGYGDNQIVGLVRDPCWIHTYWEISPKRLQQAKKELSEKWEDAKFILRVYDITDCKFNGSNANHHFDIEIGGGATNWHINVGRPNCCYCIDIGLLTCDDEFYTLARSNWVTTPRDSMSDIVDEEWMSTREDAEKMYALSGGFAVGTTSLELHKKMQERFRLGLASGAISS